MFETRKMKKTTTWALCRRSSLARSSGRISTIEAPVVPITLASTVPMARSAVLTAGRAVQVAAHEDAARDREQREQQDDERDVFEQRGVRDLGRDRAGALASRRRATSSSSAQKAETLP